MARTKKKLHPAVEYPIVAAIRAATSLPLIAGLRSASAVADLVGRIYPRLHPSRFARAETNLAAAFPHWSREERFKCSIACYQHMFRLGMEILYSPRLITKEGFSKHLILGDIAQGLRDMLRGGPVIMITGHCGNWELIGYAVSMLGFPMHAVYRPLDLQKLDQWLYETRARRGLTLVSKFGAVRSLPPILQRGEPVGIVADQSGGDRGLFVPFFGRLTSTYKSVGLLAMQTGARVVCGMARRLGPHEEPPPGPWQEIKRRGDHFRPTPTEQPSLRYAVELVDSFGPDDWVDRPDPLFYVTARYRRAIEMMVRKAPEQYFWMHRIWRARPSHERRNRPFPPMLRDKLLALPWMTQPQVDELVARSDEDRGAIARGEATLNR